MPGTMIEFKANGRTAAGYLARPASPRGHGVLVIQEYWGLVDHIKGVADRFAAEGFVALAPDLYHGEKATSPDDAGKLMMALDIAETAKDLRGAADALIARDDVTPKQVGIVGFCMGGRLVYLMSAASKNLKAGVMFYGSSTMVPFGEGATPFDRTREINCPIQGHFGEEDKNPSPHDMRKLDTELSKFGKEHEFHSYGGAAHAFVNTGSSNYRPHAAALSWPKAMEFFSRHLVG